MLCEKVTIVKLRDIPQQSSAVFDAIFVLKHNGASLEALPPATTFENAIEPLIREARYTVIKNNFSAGTTPCYQIIKHSPGTQVTPLRFAAFMTNCERPTCVVVRQYDYDRKKLRIAYDVARKNGIYEISIDDDEKEKLARIEGYTDEERKRDSVLASDVGAFFIEWVKFDAAEEDANDRQEWDVFDEDDTTIIGEGDSEDHDEWELL